MCVCVAVAEAEEKGVIEGKVRVKKKKRNQWNIDSETKEERGEQTWADRGIFFLMYCSYKH